MGWETLGDHGRLDWQSSQKHKQEKTNILHVTSGSSLRNIFDLQKIGFKIYKPRVIMASIHHYLLFTTWPMPSPRIIGTSSEYPRHEYPKGQSPSRKQVRGVVSTCLHSLKYNNKIIEK